MKKYNFNFTGSFNLATLISFIACAAALVILFNKGLNFGVDFRGGAEIQVKFGSTIDLDTLRTTLAKEGFSSSSVQNIGEKNNNEFIIKIATDAENVSAITDKLTASLKKDFADNSIEIRKTDVVGPKAGKQLRISAFKAMLYSFLGILIYIGLRFDFVYAPGAIIATIHDVILVLGVFALFGNEFSLQIVGAILAMIGYSVNDTVVVYDRIRENDELGTSKDLASNMNLALNQTLSRTFLTSGTTLAVCLAMYFFGGGVIKDFFLAMSVGIVVGTYSSVFVASNITLFLDKLKKLRQETSAA
ncbi:MAG: protein translocase subunit SecF [Bacteriovoracaceae bacterium]|nr:protein translocase subunit SecF [Bacteriovoracaceae bacterium]